MAIPTIDPAQAAAAMIANIDRMIQQVEQQVAPLRRAPGGAAGPTTGALPAGAVASAPAPAPPSQAESAAPAAPGAFGGYAPPPPSPAPAAAPAAPRGRSLEELDVFVSRLKQFKDWLQQDPRLLTVVDDYIGQRVQQMEMRQSRQNARLAVITTVAGAILGWVTSLAGTPATLLRLFGH